MHIYLTVFFFSYFTAWLSQKYIDKNRVGFLFLSIVSILLPSLLAGFRDLTVGHDLVYYMGPNFRAMQKVDNISEFAATVYLQRLEILYQTFNFIIARFTKEYFWPLFIQEIFVLSIVYKLFVRLRNQINYSLAFFVYLLFIFCDSMTMNRQIFAIALIAYSYIYVLKEKPIPYYIIVTIALGFHNSSVFGYLLYPLFLWINRKPKSVSFFTMAIFFIGGLSIYIFFPFLLNFLISKGLVSSVYERYISSGWNVHKVDLVVIIMCFIFGFIKFKNIDIKYKNNIKLLSILTFFILLCGAYNDTAQRAAIYIELYLFINILSAVKCLPGQKRRYLYSSIIVFIMLVNYIYLAEKTQFAEAIPYTSKILGIGY